MEKKGVTIILPTLQREWLNKMSQELGLKMSKIIQFLIARAMRNEDNFKEEIMLTYYGTNKKDNSSLL